MAESTLARTREELAHVTIGARKLVENYAHVISEAYRRGDVRLGKGMAVLRVKDEPGWESQEAGELQFAFEAETREHGEDSVKADEIFNILMGDQVEPRRAFIQRHALEVKNLDV